MVLLIGACNPSKKSIKILYFSKDIKGQQAVKLKNAAMKNGWELLEADSEKYLHEDSLAKVDAILLPFSSLNKMGYLELPILKRYLEAGRGGLISIADTSLSQKEWPWLQVFNTKSDAEVWTQDKSWISRLNPDFSEGDLSQILSK